jgi:hypothetical protein
MGNGVDTFDRLVERAALGDILNDDQFEPITIMAKSIPEERASRQGANGAAHRISCLQIGLYDPSGKIAVCARDEDFGWRSDGDH